MNASHVSSADRWKWTQQVLRWRQSGKNHREESISFQPRNRNPVFDTQNALCWFHGSSFIGFSIIFPTPWLAKVESSQKSNGVWFFRHFFAPYLFDRSRNNRRDKLSSAKKCSENHIWSCWDDSPSIEPTTLLFKAHTSAPFPSEKKKGTPKP